MCTFKYEIYCLEMFRMSGARRRFLQMQKLFTGYKTVVMFCSFSKLQNTRHEAFVPPID